MTVRWGLIGAGDIVRKRVAGALRDTAGCELVAVSRRDAGQAESAARDLGARLWFSEWRDLVTSPEIDAVYIATPVYLHAEQTIAAAEAGKHVLCEKPMAMSVAECDQMIDTCDASNVKLGIAYYRHFYPLLDRVKQIIASGKIGRVSVVHIDAFEHFDPPADHPRRWLLDEGASGGGPMFDFGCHRIEVLQNLFGTIDEVRSVVSSSIYARPVEDTAVAVLHFSTGMTATVTVTHATSGPRDTVDIYGTEGSLSIGSLNDGELVARTVAGQRTEQYPPHPNLHQPLVEDFVDAVRSDRMPLVDGHAGKNVNLILDEIYGRDARSAAG